jgi:predicted acylesterase/phospholipase RssA
VLGGGGAKGAFQFGVLLALHEAGERFDAVAGTSVGALNGLLWSSDNLALGASLWNGMDRSRVFKWRLTTFMFPVAAFLWLYREHALHRTAAGTPFWLQWLFTVLGRLPLITLGSFIVVGSWIGGVWPISALFAIMIAVSLFSGPDRGDIRHAYALFLGGIAQIVLLAKVVSTIYEGGFASWAFKDFVMLALGVGVMSVPLYLFVAAELVAWLKLSLFNPEPLVQIIERAAAHPVGVPTFATITDTVTYYDPDHRVYETTKMTRESSVSEPIAKSEHHARYVRIDQCTQTDLCKVLIASAALPPAIVPTQDVGSWSSVVDGGLSDNLPWIPLVLDYPCDEFVIVSCNPAKWDDATARASAAVHARRREVIAANIQFETRSTEPPSVISDPPTIIPLPTLTHWPRSEPIVIAPQKPFGWFATMDFDGHTARDRVKDGLQAGRDALKKLNAAK